MKTVIFKELECTVEKRHYENDRIALVLMQGNSKIATATINMPDYPINADEVLIKNCSENEGILEILQEAKIVGPTISQIQSGWTVAQKCKLLI